MHRDPIRISILPRFVWLSIVYSMVAALGCLSGCDYFAPVKPNTASDKTPKSVATKRPEAAELLAECIAQYKKIQRYEDRGVLHLSYLKGGVPVDQIKKVRVAFEAPNHLAIDALGVNANWTSTTWEAVVDGDQAAQYEDQRLVCPLPDVLNLDWMHESSIVRVLTEPPPEFPIQLDMLLAKEPLYILGGTDTTMTVLPEEPADLFDGHACYRLKMVHRGYTWVLWIDQKDKIVRKYKFPHHRALPVVTNDIKEIELAIEMVDAKINQPIDWSSWKVPERTDQVRVRQLIPKPLPILTSPLVGTALKPFDLKDADGKLLLDSSQRKKSISILCWLTDNDDSQKFATDLMQIRRQLDKYGLSAIAEILLVTQTKPETMTSLMSKWNCDLPIAYDRDGSLTRQFQANSGPMIVIIDKNAHVQVYLPTVNPVLVAGIPAQVTALRDGRNLAAEAIQGEIDDERRYIASKHRVVIDKDQTRLLPPIQPFQFSHYAMVKEWSVAFDNAIVAAAGENYFPQSDGVSGSGTLFAEGRDPTRIMTTLDTLGNIYAIDSQGAAKVVGTIPVDKANDALRIHIATNPWDRRWVAVIPEGLPRYWILKTPVEQKVAPESIPEATMFPIEPAKRDDPEESITSFAWTNAVAKGTSGAKRDTSRLTLATAMRLIETDPETDKASVGSATDCVAIVPRLDSSGVVLEWNVLQSSGLLRPIQSPPPSQPVKLFQPEPCQWIWGMSGRDLFLGGLGRRPTGETGIVTLDHAFQPLWNSAINVRPDQCRLLGSATTSDGLMHWLAFGPNRILHLQLVDFALTDMASFGKKIFGAAIYSHGRDLKLVVSLENEVSCWTLTAPPLRRANQSTAEPVSPQSNSGR